MAAIILHDKETEAFIKLATPLVAEESLLRKGWTVVMKIKFSLLLWIDMVSHVMAIVNGTEDWVEGALTIAAFCISNLFTFPLVCISVSENMCLNTMLMLIGLYDLKRYLDREHNDKHLREFVRPYINGTEFLTTRTLQSVYCMKADQALDDSVNFRREIMGTLPLLITKVYFAYMEPSKCSYISILRFLVIIFGLYEPIKTCIQQETSLTEMLKAGNLYDVGLVSKPHFNPNMSTRMTSVVAFFAITTSMVYRIYSIVFYTLIHPIAGLLQLIYSLFSSAILHFNLRPVYENPTIGASNLTYDIVEIVAKLFLIRYSRLYKSIIQIQLWFSWGILLVIEHILSLYLIHRILEGLVQSGAISDWDSVTDSASCAGWVHSALTWFPNLMNPFEFLRGSHAVVDILKNCAFFTALLLVNIVANAMNIIYLGWNNLNDSQFPAIAAYHIWSECMFSRVEKWIGLQAHVTQVDWLTKFMVLTLLTPEEFKEKIPLSGCNNEMPVDWKVLALKKAGETRPPGLAEVISRIQEEQSMSEQLVDFVTYVYSLERLDTDNMLRKLASLVSTEFDSIMTKMTSARITRICALLGVNPQVKGSFRN